MRVSYEASPTWVSGVLEAIPRLGLIVGGISVSAMIVLVVVGVIARSVFNYSVPIAIEYPEYLMPVICFWAAVYTLRKEGHVNANVIVHHLPDRPRQWLFLIGYLLSLGYLVILAIQFLNLALTSAKMQYISMYPTQTPLTYPQLVMFIGLVLFILQLMVEIIRKAKRLSVSYKTSAGKI